MMLLVPILVTPALAALFCLLARSRRFMAFANKAYLHDLTHSGAGRVMLVGGASLMAVGGLWLRRVVRMQY